MIVEKELFMSKLNEKRKIFIYLPKDYDMSNKHILFYMRLMVIISF